PQLPKSRHRTSLSVTSIATSLVAGLPGFPSTATTVSSPQKKLRPPPAAAGGGAGGGGGVIHALDQGLTRIAADVGSSLVLLTKKATASGPLHHHHHHQPYSYQSLPGYCPDQNESPPPHLSFSSSFAAINPMNSNAGAREGAVLERQDQSQKRSTGGPTNTTNSNGGGGSGGGASWFGSLRGLVIAGSSASRGAFSPLTMDDDKDRHSDSEHEDDNEENEEEGDGDGDGDTHPRSYPPPFASTSSSSSSSSKPCRHACGDLSRIPSKENNGFWDREMDEEKYGVAPPPPPSSSSSPFSSSSLPSVTIPCPPPPGATYRAPRWAWSMLDPSQLGRTLLAPLYQSVPASAAAADVEEHQRSEGLDENEVETRQDQRPRRYNVVQH
ncbi:hypothetical protein DFQ26_001315, partial [Actinomortierella ambigua]